MPRDQEASLRPDRPTSDDPLFRSPADQNRDETAGDTPIGDGLSAGRHATTRDGDTVPADAATDAPGEWVAGNKGPNYTPGDDPGPRPVADVNTAGATAVDNPDALGTPRNADTLGTSADADTLGTPGDADTVGLARDADAVGTAGDADAVRTTGDADVLGTRADPDTFGAPGGAGSSRTAGEFDTSGTADTIDTSRTTDTNNPAGSVDPFTTRGTRDVTGTDDDLRTTQDPEVAPDSALGAQPVMDADPATTQAGTTAPAATTPADPSAATVPAGTATAPDAATSADTRPAGTPVPGAPGTAENASVDGVAAPFVTNGDELHADWARIQSSFVDDPRGSVSQAADLVQQVSQSLVSAVQQREQTLRGAWDSQSGADTEHLRTALRDYRAFFELLVKL